MRGRRSEVGGQDVGTSSRGLAIVRHSASRRLALATRRSLGRLVRSGCGGVVSDVRSSAVRSPALLRRCRSDPACSAGFGTQIAMPCSRSVERGRLRLRRRLATRWPDRAWQRHVAGGELGPLAGCAGAGRRRAAAAALRSPARRRFPWSSGFASSLARCFGEVGVAAGHLQVFVSRPCRARSAFRRRAPGRAGRDS